MNGKGDWYSTSHRDWHLTWDIVDRMIKASRRQHESDMGSGWASAVGLLNVYLVEVIHDLPQSKQQEWRHKLESVCRDIEQKTIIQRLSQEETYERK